MTRDPHYDILFEPVKIGPVTARNRFFQVPHCNGMGHQRPASLAAMRGMKAAGGWSVVCTEEVDFHHTSDVSPFAEGQLWDDDDIPYHARVVEAIKREGALAGIELVHQGHAVANRYSRAVPLGPASLPVTRFDPLQSRAMDKSDIQDLRRWHRDAALRAKKAGYDLVYAYAGHNLTIAQHFISRRYNQRSDEYGGSLENRVRLFRELIEDTIEAVGDSCAVAVRFAVDELIGPDGITAEAEGREVVEMLAELPDLWDVNISDWPNDSMTARFSEEGYQEPYIAFVKKLTSKPVVGVGRFTSPDAMVSQIKRGILDFIGAARPSIADPFLPKKIEEGRVEDIRECIGCNICVAGDHMIVPIRCTQNPSMGEEWRRGWHPETMPAKTSDDAVLIVGGGPAGLEAAMSLGRRGYAVTLAEAETEFGGRLNRESRLPGLQTWARVRDYRLGQIAKLPNVTLYPASRLTADDICDFAAERVFLATGSTWRRDGIGRLNHRSIAVTTDATVLIPEEVFAGAEIVGPVLIFDDDHYYLGGALAEMLRRAGHEVALVTPAVEVSTWTQNTMEQERIQARLLELGVTLHCKKNLTAIGQGEAELTCLYTKKRQRIAAQQIVMVTARIPNDELYGELSRKPAALHKAGIKSLRRIGDCEAPATIAAAVYSGHLSAHEIDEQPHPDKPPFRRERAALMEP